MISDIRQRQADPSRTQKSVDGIPLGHIVREHWFHHNASNVKGGSIGLATLCESGADVAFDPERPEILQL